MNETNDNIANEIYEEMVKISGPYTNLTAITKNIVGADIYGSFHLPKFTKLNAQRNILVRYEEFFIPNDLSDKTVFDFGSNLGSISFEAARRNAKSVIGFEFCEKRVDVCERLAKYLEIDNVVKFIKTDIDDETKDIDTFIEKYGTVDITFCCALDAYVNKEKLYELVSKTTNNICYFETNSGISEKVFMDTMINLGFKLVIPLGTSKSDLGYGRLSYILIKNPKILSSRPKPSENHHYLIGDYVFSYYYDDNIFNKISSYYPRIQDIKYVPEMKFINQYIITPFYKTRLDSYDPTIEERINIKNQLIDFVVQLNNRKLAHCDLHIKNCYMDNDVLKICDWEYIHDNDVPIENHYDLTGKGENIIVPEGVGKMNVFSSYSCSFSFFLYGEINIQEFIDASKKYNENISNGEKIDELNI
ncbi:methyltransferase [Moumouvirus maliensis]|nr:methyltransferase [Moumouvirus maliensis]